MLRIIILLIISNVTFGQLHPLPSPPLKPPTDKQMKEDETNHNCLHRKKFTALQRLNFYPFNKATEVKLVSFENKRNSAGQLSLEGTLPMNGKSIDYSKLDEIKTLNKIEIERLTYIMYNTGYKGYIFTISESGCYNPHNAILFVDTKGKTFSFIELCFECEGYRTSSSKVKTGEFCNQKYELLKTFFKTAGIEIGITKGIRIKNN